MASGGSGDREAAQGSVRAHRQPELTPTTVFAPTDPLGLTAPTPPALGPSTGLDNITETVDGGEVSDSLDGMIEPPDRIPLRE